MFWCVLNDARLLKLTVQQSGYLIDSRKRIKLMNMTKKINQYFYILIAWLAGAAIPISTALQNITLPLITLLVILSIDMRHKLRVIIREPFVMACLLFYALIVVGTSWSSGNAHGIVKMLIKMIGLLELPFIIAFFSYKRNKISGFLGFAVGILLTLFFSYYSILLNIPLFHTKEWGLQYGIFRMHMYHCYFLALFACWLLYLLLNKKITHLGLKYAAIICIVICLHNIFYETWSRTGQILTTVMILSIVIQWRFKLGLLISGVIIFIFIPLTIYSSSAVQTKIKTYQENVQQYKEGKYDPNNPSMYLRWTFHKYAKKIIAEKPILGFGTGSYATEYKRLSQIDNNPYGNSQPHSDYLWFGAELGVVGMMAFSSVLLMLFIRSFSLAPPYRDFGILIAVVYAIACFENGFLTDAVSGLAFYAMVGWLFSSKFND